MGYDPLDRALMEERQKAGEGKGSLTDAEYKTRVRGLLKEHIESMAEIGICFKHTFTSAKLGFATGLLFSSFILLQGVGFMYGGLTFSAEMKRSEYDYKMNRSVPVPGMPGVMTTVEMHWCAHANNTPANVSINKECEAPLKPLKMNCQLANLFSMFDGSGSKATTADRKSVA